MRDRKAFVDIKMISAKAFLIPKDARKIASVIWGKYIKNKIRDILQKKNNEKYMKKDKV